MEDLWRLPVKDACRYMELSLKLEMEAASNGPAQVAVVEYWWEHSFCQGLSMAVFSAGHVFLCSRASLVDLPVLSKEYTYLEVAHRRA
jgi:hypothetical protein